MAAPSVTDECPDDVDATAYAGEAAALSYGLAEGLARLLPVGGPLVYGGGMHVLDGILAGVREDLARRKGATSLAELRARVGDMAPPLDPLPAFRASNISVIAEVKRRSPSKGELAEIPDPASLAMQYAEGGAAAISVLTEERRFGGSLADLDAVRARVSVPILRKDFLVDPYQLWEARAHGADLALLMVVSLPGGLLDEMVGVCRAAGLTPFIESHTAAELDRASRTGEPLLGVNARNLTTLAVDRHVFRDLAPHFPAGAVRVAESGVAGPQDVAEYRSWGGRRGIGRGSPRALGQSALVGTPVHGNRSRLRVDALTAVASPAGWEQACGTGQGAQVETPDALESAPPSDPLLGLLRLRRRPLRRAGAAVLDDEVVDTRRPVPAPAGSRDARALRSEGRSAPCWTRRPRPRYSVGQSSGSVPRWRSARPSAARMNRVMPNWFAAGAAGAVPGGESTVREGCGRT